MKRKHMLAEEALADFLLIRGQATWYQIYDFIQDRLSRPQLNNILRRDRFIHIDTEKQVRVYGVK